MSEPNGINSKIEHCPQEIKENPLTHDECSAPLSQEVHPRDRYRRLSLYTDSSAKLQLKDYQARYSHAFGILSRFGGKTKLGFWGLGAQLESNFKDELSALGRVQTSFNLQRFGRDRLTLAALGGIRHRMNQNHELEGFSDIQKITGTQGQLGLELALEWRVAKTLTFVAPFISGRYTFPGSVEIQGLKTKANMGASWDLLLGARLMFDFLPVGE